MFMRLMHEIWNQQNAKDLPGSFPAPGIKGYFSVTASTHCSVKGHKKKKQGRQKAPFKAPEAFNWISDSGNLILPSACSEMKERQWADFCQLNRCSLHADIFVFNDSFDIMISFVWSAAKGIGTGFIKCLSCKKSKIFFQAGETPIKLGF